MRLYSIESIYSRGQPNDIFVLFEMSFVYFFITFDKNISSVFLKYTCNL